MANPVLQEILGPLAQFKKRIGANYAILGPLFASKLSRYLVLTGYEPFLGKFFSLPPGKKCTF